VATVARCAGVARAAAWSFNRSHFNIQLCFAAHMFLFGVLPILLISKKAILLSKYTILKMQNVNLKNS
jgi:hypothetical protein